MADATTGSRWFRHLRLRTAHAERDLADCGTAFGLDLSMQPEEPPAPASARAPRDPDWWRRLGARRALSRP